MAETQKERRARIKIELLERRGDSCSSCGYQKTSSALCFHHLDHSTKSFNISGMRLISMSREKLEEEVDKCIVLCHNCHAERHDEEGRVHENGKRTKKL